MLALRKSLKKYGADTARLFILFAAPPERELDWSDAGVEGSFRFLNRVYRLVYELRELIQVAPDSYILETEEDKSLAFAMNSTIKKVSEDVGGRFSFNTAISSIMEMVNEMYKYKEYDDINLGLLKAAVNNLVLILSPFTPHICEEMWQNLGHDQSVYKTEWPKYDESALVKDTVEIVIQINGKVKEKMSVANNLDKATFEKMAMENDKVKALTEGKNNCKNCCSAQISCLTIVVK